ncbi:MAG: MerR family transcriptional regulator, partial [Oscillospiraceae bacterium]|nr:MerR family transcriptional regulator [Oscillospiraceae bacterium]
MRINEVEKLVGVSKKNIRFYEAQGLLEPRRNSENGYREYSDRDIEELNKIRLLRKLSIPISEIQKLRVGQLTLEDCMRRHAILIEREEQNLANAKIICHEIEQSRVSHRELDAPKYLDRISQLERGGASFPDTRSADRRVSRAGPIIAASVFITLMLAVIA